MTALATLLLGALQPGDPAAPRELWIYVQTNLQVDANADKVEALLARAARAGYTRMLLADSKMAKLGDVIRRYFRNAERVKKAAAASGIEIVPAVFPVGYSGSMLWHDPNLAEGLPVRDALFVVEDGRARLVSDPPPTPLGKWSWKDPTVDDTLTVRDPDGKNARFSQKVKVVPFRQYHVTVDVKTEAFRGKPEVKILAGGRNLNHADLGSKPTQDWTTHHVVFNSLDNETVQVYFGCWNGTTGTLSWRHPRIEETGLVNLLRRDGAPLVVRRDGDGAVLEEGKDFEKLVDPGMGNRPWPGSFDIWHEPPEIRTSLPDGTRLRVSYYHPVTIHWGQIMACPSEPRVLELLKDEARRVHELWGAKAYFMSHDEIRVLNWDASCRKRGMTAGEILADNVRACTRILREVNPGGEIYVWSDMFDPHHNARDTYYLVRGSLKESWEGLDKDVIIACWYRERAEKSLAWFSGRGHRTLIAGYYDSPPDRVRAWLEAEAKVGTRSPVMYTTWRSNFDDLEAFAKAVRSHD